MQYILTQEEYDALLQRKEVSLRLSKSKLQQLCSKIADTMPIKRPWARGADPEPWGCILTHKGSLHYCDECPVREICPEGHKEYSQ